MMHLLDWNDVGGGGIAGEKPTVLLPYSSLVPVGPVLVLFRSNIPNPKFMRFLPRAVQDRRVEYEVIVIDLGVDSIEKDLLQYVADRSRRAELMRRGCYRGDYFGAPAYLVARHRRIIIFCDEPEKIVWPYVIKLILEVEAFDRGGLHLKAAAMVTSRDEGILVVGPNGVGKTTFVLAALSSGARLISNTHVFIRDQSLFGVRSPLRLRGGLAIALIGAAAENLSNHLDGDEYLLPYESVGRGDGRTKIGKIVLLDKAKPREALIAQVDSETVAGVMSQFSLGLTAYGLKDDILEAAGGSSLAFAAYSNRIASDLRAFCAARECFHVRVDLAGPNRNSAIEELENRIFHDKPTLQ
jgi:hypothetical protein